MFRLHSTAFFLLAIFFKIVVLTENSLLCEFNPQDKQTIEKIISKKKKNKYFKMSFNDFRI